MVYQNYFITGILREPILFIEWAFIFLCMELGIIFILKYLEKPKEIRSSQELSYTSLFISYSITWICFLIRNFYSTTTQDILLFLLVQPDKIRKTIINSTTETFVFLFIISTQEILIILNK